MEVKVNCPVCAKESTIFPFYTEGEAKYPCGCTVSFYDKVKSVEYVSDEEISDEAYARLLDRAKQCNCGIDSHLTSEEYEKCCDDAETSSQYWQNYKVPDYGYGGTSLSGRWMDVVNDTEESPVYDDIEDPFHYASMKYQPIDVAKEWTKDLEPFNAICVHNILKYICRFSNKDGKKDLEKARWYLNKLIGECEDV